MKPRDGSALRLQAIRYLLVGGATFVCYFAFLGLLFSLLGLPYPLAVAIAYAIAVALHFLANRSYTFDAASASAAPQLTRYVAVVVLNYTVQLGIIFLAYDVAGWNFYVAAFLAILATLVSGFLLMKSWVF